MSQSILIVEDERMVARSLSQLLKGYGYDVAGIAHSGEDAVRKCEENPVQLVLMDIVLEGGMDGIEAAERIQGRRNIPVVYLTAYTDDDVLERMKHTSAFGYLAKPLIEAELKGTLQTALRRHDAERRLMESEAGFRDLVDLLPQFVAVLDAAGRFSFANRHALTNTGYTWEEVSQLSGPLDIVVPGDRARVADYLDRIFSGETVGEVELSVVRKDGSTFPVLAYGSPIVRDQAVVGVRIAAVDITERKRAELFVIAQRDLGFHLSATSDLKEALGFCLDAAFKISGPDAGVVYLADEASEFDAVVYRGVSDDVMSEFSHLSADSTAARSILRGEPIYSGAESTETSPRLPAIGGMEVAAVVPIFYEGRTIASLNLLSRERGEIPLQTRQGLEAIASQVGTAIAGIRAQESLRTSRAGFNGIVEKSADGVLVLDEEGRVLYANLAAIALFERSKEDMGKAWFAEPSVCENTTELDILRQDGTIRFAEIRLDRTRWEDRPACLAVLRDVTDRRRDEEARKLLATAVEQSAETIIITDEGGDIEYVNPAFRLTSGYRAADVIGKKTSFLHNAEHDEEFGRRLMKTVRSGNVWAGRFVSKRKDGAGYYEDATVSPVRDASGEIVNYVVVKRDVTQQLRLEEQLRMAQKMEAVGTLAGGIAHDFNNLLQVIIGYGDMLSADMAKTDPSYRGLEAILQAGKRGAELVKSILTFGRKANTYLRPINLNDQIRQTHDLLLRTIPKMIEIELNLADDLYTINADPSQMEQILLNLAVNARDAMPDGGRLIIETENVYLDETYCRRRWEVKPGHYVRMVVSDTGRGMPPEVVERVFEPFYTTKEVGQGTGLGLSMVFGIVKTHGGHIVCYSEPGVGTAFRIDFPVMEAVVESPAEEVDESVAAGTETILVVDDEEHIQQLARRRLAQAGYGVLLAANGREALEIYRENRSRISLVVLDLIMPEMGGKECLEKLLQINPEVKVLIASGFSASGPARDTIQAGAKGFLDKPFRTNSLLDMIREVLDAD